MKINNRNRILIPAVVLLTAFFTGCESDDTADDSKNVPAGTNVPGNNRQTGQSAKELLSDETFTELKVEILYMEGSTPDAASVNNLRDFLVKYLNKPNGIHLIERRIPAGEQSSYSVEEILEIEKEYREEYNRDDVIAASLLLLDGDYSVSENVLGIAYRNTSMALFQRTINRHTGGIGQPSKSKVETAVMNHEFGHIMGLVNNGTPMVNDHQDEERGAHCDNENCLMYYAVETTDILDNLIDNSVPDLDENCRIDVAAHGGK